MRWTLIVVFRFTKNVIPCLSSESMEARQRSYDLGIHLGYQRRNKDVIAWVKKRRRTIRREDLISFLCGKVPPPRTARAPPRVAMVSASRPSPPETGSSVETDLQPVREAIALHGRSKCHVQLQAVAIWEWGVKVHTACCAFIFPFFPPPFPALVVPWRAFLSVLVLLAPQLTLPSPSVAVGMVFMMWTSTPSSLRRWHSIWIPQPIVNEALPPVVTSSQTHLLINVTGCSELFLHH